MPQACDGPAPGAWSTGASVNAFETDIVFGGSDVRVRQTAAHVTLGRFGTSRWGWTATASVVLGGEIEDRRIVSGQGFGLGVTWLPVYERASRPFLALTGSAGTSQVRAHADDGTTRRWTANDGRIGVLSGKTFGRFVPYAAGRAFAGPVRWHRDGESVVGGDRRHVTVGAGFTLHLPAAFDLSAEVMPLGERSVAAGLTRRW